MLADQIVGDQIADALIERGRALQVREQERQARDLEPLIRLERLGLVDVAEGLISEKPFGGDERFAPGEKIVQRVAGEPQRRQNPALGTVLQRQPQRPGSQFDGAGLRCDLIEYHRQCLPVACRLALDLDDLPAVRHRLKHNDEARGQLHRQHRLFAGRHFDRLDRKRGEGRFQILRQVGAGAPENLAEIFGLGQRIRIVAGDAAQPRAHGEGDFDHFVERGLVVGGAQRAGIFVVVDGLERRAGVEHAAAGGAKHVPRQFEQAEPRGVQECGDRAFFVEAVLAGEVEHIDAAQFAIRRVADGALNRGDAIGIGRLPQHIEESFAVVHRSISAPGRLKT